jgi:Predicted hydrolase of the alpha/beta superfamily
MQKDIQLTSRGITLRGMLHKPENTQGKIPLVIILHGFGGNKMGPNFVLVRLSKALEENNIASVRFDFGGSGESDGEFINMTMSGEVEDANNIFEYVKSLDFIDSDNIGVLGFSMGGAVASILAGRLKKQVKSLCLWAPAGNMHEIVKKDFIGAGYNEFLQNGYHDFDGMLIGKDFVNDLSDINIYNEASKYQGDVLLIHGDCDDVVSITASNEYIKKSYRERARLTVINGADHMFTRYSFGQSFIIYTLDFFKTRLVIE